VNRKGRDKLVMKIMRKWHLPTVEHRGRGMLGYESNLGKQDACTYNLSSIREGTSYNTERN